MTAAPVIPALDLDAIACIVHETLRAYSAELGEGIGEPWEQTPRWERYSTLSAVSAILRGEVTTPEQSHARWCEHRTAEGWQIGPHIDGVARLHPHLRPWSELPAAIRRRDVVFYALVEALTCRLGAP